MGRRRRRRRDLRRHRRPRAVGRRRPDAQRHAARHDARRRAPGRVAPRHAAARSAGLAQGGRTARAVHPARRHGARLPQGRRGRLRRRRRPGRRTPPDGHGVAGVRRPAGLGHLLQARRQAPAGVVDSVAGVVRSPSRPRVVGGLHRAAAPRQRPPSERALGHAAGAGRRPAAGPGGDLRRRPSRAAAAAHQDVVRLGVCPATRAATRSGRRSSGGSPSKYPGEDKDPAQVRAWGRTPGCGI